MSLRWSVLQWLAVGIIHPFCGSILLWEVTGRTEHPFCILYLWTVSLACKYLFDNAYLTLLRGVEESIESLPYTAVYHTGRIAAQIRSGNLSGQHGRQELDLLSTTYNSRAIISGKKSRCSDLHVASSFHSQLVAFSVRRRVLEVLKANLQSMLGRVCSSNVRQQQLFFFSFTPFGMPFIKLPGVKSGPSSRSRKLIGRPCFATRPLHCPGTFFSDIPRIENGGLPLAKKPTE